MNTLVTDIAGKVLPESLFRKYQPQLSKVDDIAFGDSEYAVAQRMAMLVFAIRVASAAIALVSQVLLARWMGTFEYGIFVAVWTGIIIASTLTGLGLPSAVLRFVAEYNERGRPSLVWGIIRGGYSITLLANTIIATLGCMFLWLFPEKVTGYFIIPLYLGLLCLPAMSVEGISEALGRPFNWFRLSLVPTFIIRPVGLLILMAIAVQMGYEASAITAMWCAFIVIYVSVVVQFITMIRKLRKRIDTKKPARYRMGYWLAVSLPIFLVESFYVLLTQVDVIFVSWLTNPEDTAVYFAATKILALVHFVYFAIRTTASPRYAAIHASKDKAKLREFVSKTVQWTFWPSLFIGAVMVLLGKYFLALFGPEFVAGTSVLWILVIGIVIRSSIGPAESLLVMSGNQNICAFVYFGGLFVNVTLNLTLIPVYGIQGAAVATALAMAFESLALYAIAKRTLGVHAFVIPSWSTVTRAA